MIKQGKIKRLITSNFLSCVSGNIKVTHAQNKAVHNFALTMSILDDSLIEQKQIPDRPSFHVCQKKSLYLENTISIALTGFVNLLSVAVTKCSVVLEFTYSRFHIIMSS